MVTVLSLNNDICDIFQMVDNVEARISQMRRHVYIRLR